MKATDKTARFRTLHQPGSPFILPNPWDVGSARILEGLGFSALATTSSGFALTQGRADYRVSRDDALAHCRAVVAAVGIPVTADLENGFGARPEDVAETIRLAAETGLCGGSIEDSTGDSECPIFERTLAEERVRAAVEAARSTGFVLTARAEGYLHGQDDREEIIERLEAFAQAGADVVYAPGVQDLESVRVISGAVSKPVNVLVYGDLTRHSQADFAKAGAARLSVGGALAFSAYGVLAKASEMLQHGTFDRALQREGAATISRFLTDG